MSPLNKDYFYLCPKQQLPQIIENFTYGNERYGTFFPLDQIQKSTVKYSTSIIYIMFEYLPLINRNYIIARLKYKSQGNLDKKYNPPNHKYRYSGTAINVWTRARIHWTLYAKYYYCYSFTLYPAYRRVVRENIVWRRTLLMHTIFEILHVEW